MHQNHLDAKHQLAGLISDSVGGEQPLEFALLTSLRCCWCCSNYTKPNPSCRPDCYVLPSLPTQSFASLNPGKSPPSVLSSPCHPSQKRFLPLWGLLSQFTHTTLVAFSFLLCFMVTGVQCDWPPPRAPVFWTICTTGNAMIFQTSMKIPFFHSVDCELF